MTTYSDLLDKPTDDLKRPSAWPVGTYLCRIEGPEEGLSREKQTPFMRFHLVPLRAEEDIDQSELGSEFTERFGKRAWREDFFITQDALFRVKEFYVKYISPETTGKTTRQLLAEISGKLIKAHVRQMPNKAEPGNFYNEVDGFAKAEE